MIPEGLQIALSINEMLQRKMTRCSYACLIWNLKVVEERMVGGNGALGNKCDTICIVGRFLEETMPVLIMTNEVKLG